MAINNNIRLPMLHDPETLLWAEDGRGRPRTAGVTFRVDKSIHYPPAWLPIPRLCLPEGQWAWSADRAGSAPGRQAGMAVQATVRWE